MIALIKRIEENGFTYSAGGNLYFDISKFPYYGDLAMLRLDELKAGARTGHDENKRNPGDFALWFTKSKFENQALVWDSPWGRGYPGWHIECSAMSIKYLGETFDIHAGGIDHIPVHHTNEIAQSEAATGKHPWVKYWIHNEFLVMDKGKMSKSEGGFLTLDTLVKEAYDPLDYRYFLLGGHYRSQLQFSYSALDSAKNSRKSLGERLRALYAQAGSPPELAANQNLRIPQDSKAGEYLANFNKALLDDLSTPRGLAELWGVLKNQAVKPAEALAAAFDMDRVLGLNLLKETVLRPENSEDPAFAAEIESLIKERAEAKAAKNYGRADEIRGQLKEKGIIARIGSKKTGYWQIN
jgi:cysteinyl-tRNA synthetase